MCFGSNPEFSLVPMTLPSDVALDDFGDGRSSLRLWAELRPEIVKIDKYFIHDVATEPVKVQTLRGLTRFAVRPSRGNRARSRRSCSVRATSSLRWRAKSACCARNVLDDPQGGRVIDGGPRGLRDVGHRGRTRAAREQPRHDRRHQAPCCKAHEKLCQDATLPVRCGAGDGAMADLLVIGREPADAPRF